MPGSATPWLAVDFGREVSGELPIAERREWLVTNGLGGFASGTVSGNLTRRYHGLLIAALRPPLKRTLLVSKLDETAHYDGRLFALTTNRWTSGVVDPAGYRYIERFRLEGTSPVWTFALADALVEKRIWMQEGSNTTYVSYQLIRASGSLELQLEALVNYRDHHGGTHAGDWRMEVEAVAHGLRVVAFSGATPFYILSSSAVGRPAHDWYRNFDLPAERCRGLEASEDHLHAGSFRAELRPGESLTLVSSTEAAPDLDGRVSWEARRASEQALVERWATARPKIAAGAPSWVRQLVLAADQFHVRRPLDDDPDARSVLAGYHWFGDWGRDTMIALPGLTLVTGRPDDARRILRTYARFVDRGMLPNLFPDGGEAPEYNSVDAALWFFEAVRQYYAATRDTELLRELFPVLTGIVDWHVRGTRSNIHMDSSDGLLFAGEAGVQLTWMDARVGDWVVTPRTGKPVEVNALWYNALVNLALVAGLLGKAAKNYETLARRTRAGFQRFWNAETGYCFDVLDGPEGNDPSLRPNQIFAVSLPVGPLSAEQQRAVVDVCARQLLTSHGLRTLAPSDPRYVGQYRGSPQQRDAAYHQGTVWGWLLGPFVLAHLRVYEDPLRAASYLEGMSHQIQMHGLGTLSEIYDGDAPFQPRGSIAQAWTVAEVLRAWQGCRAARLETDTG